jgi:ABC-2 type transport system permease protein
MNLTAIHALVRNDLRVYRTDRRALLIGILVPILVAAFFGYVFGGNGNTADPGKIPIAVVDEDHGEVSRGIAADLAKDPLLSVRLLTRTQAEAQVRAGAVQAAAILPKAFGDSAAKALFSNRDKPQVLLLVDPSQPTTARIVQGLFAQYGMQEITKSAFSGATGQAAIANGLDWVNHATTQEVPERSELKAMLEAAQALNARTAKSGTAAGSGLQRGLSIPYEVATTSMTSAQNIPYNGYAHSFAGMTVQFILFTGIDAGVLLLLARERGVWQRLRTAPVSKAQFLLAKVLATTLIGLFQFIVVYAVACLVFHVRIEGSRAGFVALAVLFCVLNASFGLMLAAIGRTAGATRGIAMMVILLLVMLGGAWVPAFVFPKWLQQASLAAPTRWAVDGLDAMTWRGLGFGTAVAPLVVIGASALACMAIAIWRFRWEE